MSAQKRQEIETFARTMTHLHHLEACRAPEPLSHLLHRLVVRVPRGAALDDQHTHNVRVVVLAGVVQRRTLTPIEDVQVRSTSQESSDQPPRAQPPTRP